VEPNDQHIPLKKFLDYLTGQGFVVGVDTHLQVNRLLNSIGNTITIPQLRYLLCPLFATSPEEQEKFYKLFDQYFEANELKSTISDVDDPPDPPDPPNPTIKIWKVIGIIAAVLAVVLIWNFGDSDSGFEVGRIITKEKEKIDSCSAAVNTGRLDTDGDGIIDLCDYDDDGDGFPDSTDFCFKDYDEKNIDTDGDGLGISCDPCPEIDNRIDADCDGFPNDIDYCPGIYSLENIDTDGDSIGDACDPCRDVYNKNDLDCDGILDLFDECQDDSTNTCLIDKDKDGIIDDVDNCPYLYNPDQSDIDNDFIGDVCDPINHRKPEFLDPYEVDISKLELKRDQSDLAEESGLWTRFGNPILWSLLALLLIGYVLFEIYKLSKRKLFLEREKRKQAPYSYQWNIQQPTGFKLFTTKTFYETGKHLRERQLVDSQQLNIKQTIQETVRSGGFPKLIFSSTTKQPEYLILIEQQTDADHQTQLFHQLIKELQQLDLHLEVFYYEDDPRICYRPGEQQRTSLHELMVRFSGYRLLLFGDGKRLVSSNTGGFSKWAKELLDWKDRCIFTPVAPSQWGYHELILAKHFVVLPASLKGVLSVTEHFEQEEPSDLGYWYKRSAAPTIPDEDDDELLEVLQDYLGKDLFQWFCACAVYPEVSWDLFLRLDKVISDGKLRTEANLLKMVRLPWLRNGYIPNELRVALIDKLSKKNETKIRRELIQLLDANQPEEGSYAGDEHRMQLIVQQLALGGLTGREKRQRLEAMRDMPESEIEREYAVVKMLEINYTSRLQLQIPQRFKKLFYRKGLPFLGMKPVVRFAMVAVLAGIISLGFITVDPIPDNTKKDGQTVNFRGKQYQLNSNSDWSDFYRYQGQVYYKESIVEHDSLKMDSAYLAYSLVLLMEHTNAEFRTPDHENWRGVAYETGNTVGIFNEKADWMAKAVLELDAKYDLKLQSRNNGYLRNETFESTINTLQNIVKNVRGNYTEDLEDKATYNSGIIAMREGDYERAKTRFYVAGADPAQHQLVWASYYEFYEDVSEKYEEPIFEKLERLEKVKLENFFIEVEGYLSSPYDSTFKSDKLTPESRAQLNQLICKLTEYLDEGRLTRFKRVSQLCNPPEDSDTTNHTNPKRIEIYTYVSSTYRKSVVTNALSDYDIVSYAEENEFDFFKSEINGLIGANTISQQSPAPPLGAQLNYILYEEKCDSCALQAELIGGKLADMGIDTELKSYSGQLGDPIKIFLCGEGNASIRIHYLYAVADKDFEKIRDYLQDPVSATFQYDFVINSNYDLALENEIKSIANNLLKDDDDLLILYNGDLADEIDQMIEAVQSPDLDKWIDPDFHIRKERDASLPPNFIRFLHRKGVNNFTDPGVDEIQTFIAAEEYLIEYDKSSRQDDVLEKKILNDLNNIDDVTVVSPDKLDYYKFIFYVLQKEYSSGFKILNKPNLKISDERYERDFRLQYFVALLLLSEDKMQAEAGDIQNLILGFDKARDYQKKLLTPGSDRSLTSTKKTYGNTKLKVGQRMSFVPKGESLDVRIRIFNLDQRKKEVEIGVFKGSQTLMKDVLRFGETRTFYHIFDTLKIKLKGIEDDGFNPFTEAAVFDFKYLHYIKGISTNCSTVEYGKRVVKITITDPYWAQGAAKARFKANGNYIYPDRDKSGELKFIGCFELEKGERLNVNFEGEDLTRLDEVTISYAEYDGTTTEIDGGTHKCIGKGNPCNDTYTTGQ
jgi:hypothetical protein